MEHKSDYAIFTNKVTKAIINITGKNKRQKKILDIFGAKKFIKAKTSDYKEIELIGREIGKIK